MKHMNAYVLLVLSMAALSPALTIMGGEDVRRFCQRSLSDGSLRKNVGDPNHCTL